MDLLKQINDPAALRSLSRAELKTLADQLRNYLLESVS
jgi:1-deoxy-D-xylulose-5-phosphate synthase